MDNEYYFKIKFQGSKEQFYEALRNYRIARLYSENDPYVWIRDIDTITIRHTSDVILLWDRKRSCKTLAFIKVQSLPNNQALLIVFLSSQSWREYQPYWILLLDELKEQGWISDKPSGNETTVMSDSSIPVVVANDKPKWFPKKTTTLSDWKKIYAVILDLREKYLQEFINGNTEDPELHMTDLIDAIKSDFSKSYSERFLRNVSTAGDNGWLV